MVWSAFPYSCLLFRMCSACAEICFDVSCVFVMSYSHCFPVWPTYELLHVLHFNLYMPLVYFI